MKQVIILAILLILIGGCSTLQDSQSEPATNITHAISGTQDLLLNEQDLQQLGLTGNPNETYLQQFEITGNGTNCRTDEGYTDVVDSSEGQYSICDYIISGLNDTDVIIEFQRFADYEALNGSYQYGSSHLYSVQGVISENEYGDQSIFRVNNENDYGGQFNEPGVYFYHLWFTKDLYLIHITSKGSKDAEDHIAKIGQQILSKLG
ncbi:hypothetical protein ACFL6I_22395 [candidate division KSB1 bacterium]